MPEMLDLRKKRLFLGLLLLPYFTALNAVTDTRFWYMYISSFLHRSFSTDIYGNTFSTAQKLLRGNIPEEICGCDHG